MGKKKTTALNLAIQDNFKLFQKLCVVCGSVWNRAEASNVGAVIGWIWGGKACGLLPTHQQSKQILGGWAGMVGVNALCL